MKPALGDVVLVLTVLIVSVSAWVVLEMTAAAGNRAVIQPVGRPGQVLALESSSRVVSVLGPLGETRVEVKEGQVRIVDSPCPRHICVSMGWISRSGETLVCIPNGLVVRIEGKEGSGFDAVTQ